MLLSISDHATRIRAQNPQLRPVIFGALLGSLNKTEAVEMFQAVELILDSNNRISPTDESNPIIDMRFLLDQTQQCKPYTTINTISLL